MALPALDVRAAMTGVEREQVFEERPTQPQHGGPDGELQGAQAVGSSHAAERARGGGGQTGQLGGELRPEALGEPPFSAPAPPPGPSPASGLTGRASQIASLSSTISPTIALNRW